MALHKIGNMSELPSIQEYYKGKTVFITGGSGFMGKVLVEKLLYSCSELERIYLLMRSKRGVQPKERLTHLYSESCFDRLRNERPGLFESKVFLIAGDVSEDGLGLSNEDRATLVNSVQVVFHVAASVRFNDPLSYSVKLNLRGTKEIIDMAYEMTKLESFVHVSTAYANCNKKTIKEVMYPPHADWRETLEVCERLDSNTIEKLTSKYIGSLPNTYVFTKQLAEHVVYEQRGKLPVVIIRPSVVVSTYTEPLPGWNCNFNGPIGIFVGFGKGVLRTCYGDENVHVDYIPADMAIRHIIVASWARGIQKLEDTDDCTIYNCCIGNLHKVTIRDFGDIGRVSAEEIPLDNNLFGMSDQVIYSPVLYHVSVLFKHLLPALFLDALLKLVGQRPRLFATQRRIYNAFVSLRTFMINTWSFNHENFLQVRSCIKDCDKSEFYYDIESIDYSTLFKRANYGARRFILKEKDEDLPRARLQLNIMTFFQRASAYLFNGIIAYFVVWKCFLQYYVESILMTVS